MSGGCHSFEGGWQHQGSKNRCELAVPVARGETFGQNAGYHRKVSVRGERGCG